MDFYYPYLIYEKTKAFIECKKPAQDHTAHRWSQAQTPPLKFSLTLKFKFVSIGTVHCFDKTELHVGNRSANWHNNLGSKVALSIKCEDVYPLHSATPHTNCFFSPSAAQAKG